MFETDGIGQTLSLLVMVLDDDDTCLLTPLSPAVTNCCCSKGSTPYWSNPPFLIFDIRALWRPSVKN